VSAAAGRPVAIHQFIPALNPHDATGTHTLRTRDVLRRAGWRSEIFAEAIHDDLAGEAYKYWAYRDRAAEGDVALYQFTTSSSLAGFLAELALPLILDFHNFTGPELFAGWEPQSVVRATRAAEELDLLAPLALLGLAKSSFSERTLREAGCRRTAVVPVLADYGRVNAEPDSRVLDELEELGAEGGTDILFVGRVVPSKAQHDLVKALWAYRRLYDARARLHLLGGTSSYEYNKSLQDFVDDLGLARAVRIAGEVSDASLAAYFAVAEVFLSLSVHEGFGVPLVEAMSAGIPVVTLEAGAVSETVCDAGLVLESTDPSFVAAALHRVSTDDVLRHRLIEAGRSRAASLAGDRVATELAQVISAALGRP
jgi:L-malate glycosyltransferase